MTLFTTFVLVSLIPSTLASTCRYIQAQAGDGCWALANRCGMLNQDVVEGSILRRINGKLSWYVCQIAVCTGTRQGSSL